MQKLAHVMTNMRDTYFETHHTLKWVWSQILSRRSRINAIKALVLLLLAMFLSMSVTFVMKEIVNALAEGDRSYALTLLCVGAGSIYAVSRLMIAYHDYTRELAWNDNYRSVVTRFSQLFFRRTVGELIAEDNEVGAEQIESAKDRVQNILYLLLFEGSSVVATMFVGIFLMCIVDPIAGGAMFFLILTNILWFLYFNTIIDEKMVPIDKELRRANRRMVEKWGLVLSTKVNGVEKKVYAQTEQEIEKPLSEDKAIWAGWFLWLDLIRSGFNILSSLCVLGYGILYGNWNAGDFAAMFAWMSLVIEKFGFVGHIMRHLTSQIVRLKAVREALTSEPSFLQNEGIVYKRSA